MLVLITSLWTFNCVMISFLLITSTVPRNTDALHLIDVVGLGWGGGGVLITSLWQSSSRLHRGLLNISVRVLAADTSIRGH